MADLTDIRSLLGSLNTSSHINELKPSDNLFERGVLDSLMLIQFVIAIENAFQMRIPNQEINYENFSSIEAVESLLRRLKK